MAPSPPRPTRPSRRPPPPRAPAAPRPAALLFLTLSLCLLLLARPAAASYGHEPQELVAEQPATNAAAAQPAPVPLPAPARRDAEDDATIRADDASFEKLDSQRSQLAAQLSEIERLRSKMLSKSELLKRVRALQGNATDAQRQAAQVRRQENSAEHDLSVAVQRRNATFDAKESVARERESVETLLQELNAEKKTYDKEISKFDDEKKRMGAREKELENERERLLLQVRKLVSHFKHQGMHNWLEHYLRDLPPVVRETIVKTSSVLEPVIHGVEEAAELTEEMSTDTAQAMTRYLPVVRDSPFYTGLVFYVILLCPMVVAAWLVLKIRARLSMLTVEHYLIAMNLYFGIMSTACALMTMISRADILKVFRHRSRGLAEGFMLVHGLLFLVHLIMHGMTAYVTGARKDFAQYISMSCVGLHFFMNGYKRTILDEDPDVGPAAYLFYAAAFLYTLYDRGVHIIEAAVKGRKAKPAEFSTFPTEPVGKQLPNGAGPPGADSTVYFAGLPVFNGPSQSSVDDAKTI